MKYRVLAAIALIAFSASANAEQFYKWVDENGVTQYSQKPPPSGKAGVLNIDLPPAGTSGSQTQKTVVIYTAEWCGVCHAAKKYFSEHNVAYTEYDVEKSAKGRADYQRLHGKGVPIVLVGAARMDGFSAEQFEAMLK